MEKRTPKGKVFRCLLEEDTAVFRSYLEFVCLNLVTDFRNSDILKSMSTSNKKKHHLITGKEMDVLSVILYNRYKLSSVINEEDVLNQTVTNTAARYKIRNKLGITAARFGEIIKHLDQAHVLIPVYMDEGRVDYYKIHEKFIPQVYKDENGKLCCTMRIILRSENNGTILA